MKSRMYCCNLCGVLIPYTYFICFLLCLFTGVNFCVFVGNSDKERIIAIKVNVWVQSLVFLIRSQQDPVSNIGSNIDFPSRGFCEFPPARQMPGCCVMTGDDRFFNTLPNSAFTITSHWTTQVMIVIKSKSTIARKLPLKLDRELFLYYNHAYFHYYQHFTKWNALLYIGGNVPKTVQ